MAQPAKRQVVIRDFPGLGTKADATDVPPGMAVVQTNVTSETVGELRSRACYSVVSFEEE